MNPEQRAAAEKAMGIWKQDAEDARLVETQRKDKLAEQLLAALKGEALDKQAKLDVHGTGYQAWMNIKMKLQNAITTRNFANRRSGGKSYTGSFDKLREAQLEVKRLADNPGNGYRLRSIFRRWEKRIEKRLQEIEAPSSGE